MLQHSDSQYLKITLLLYLLWCFPSGMVVRNLLATAGDTGDVSLIPGLGRSPGGRNGDINENSCLKNSRDRGA